MFFSRVPGIRRDVKSDLLISPRNFCLAGKMGRAISFDGQSFAGGAGGARLPARAELGPLLA
jgi:hypothetical protein